MKHVLPTNLLVLEDSATNPDAFFTEELFNEWYDNLYECAIATVDEFKNLLGHMEGINYQLNPTLLKEVVYDAIVGLKKISDSGHNNISKPSPFKIAAHLGYWFLVHKPVLFLYFDSQTDLKDLRFTDEIETDEDLKTFTIWEMKHINEVVATTFMVGYIFDLDKEKQPICGASQLSNVKKGKTFCFETFEDMNETIIDMLRYHLAYRIISPEILEHFLEGYTLHPIWALTSRAWELKDDE